MKASILYLILKLLNRRAYMFRKNKTLCIADFDIPLLKIPPGYHLDIDNLIIKSSAGTPILKLYILE